MKASPKNPQSIVARPRRDAWFVIRGFYYQIQVTVQRWIHLAPAEVLVCESAEDIELIRSKEVDGELQVERLLEPVKVRKTLTLRSAAVISTVVRYFESTATAGQPWPMLRFITTASASRERSLDFPRDLPGLSAWNAKRNRALDTEEGRVVEAMVQSLLSGANRPPDIDHALWVRFQKQIHRLTPQEFGENFIDRIEWAINSRDVVSLREQLCTDLMKLKLVGGANEASNLVDLLIAYVFHFLTKSGPKRLTAADLKPVAEQSLAPSDRAIVNYLESLAGQTSQQLGRIENNTDQILEEVQGLKPALATMIEEIARPTFDRTLAEVNLHRNLVDRETENRLERLRKVRHFDLATAIDLASHLASDLLEGELVLASADTKSRALAWSARVQLALADREVAKAIIKVAREIAVTEEVKITEALETSFEGNVALALSALSKLKSSAARSAAFIAIKFNRTPDEALEWLSLAHLTLSDLDADGKFFVIVTQLEAKRFEEAVENLDKLTKDDFEQIPGLWLVAAKSHLATVVPNELAADIPSQLPFMAVELPLAGDRRSLERRQKSREFYLHAAEAAARCSCIDASRTASDWALLLGLRQPDARLDAIADLERSMRDPEHRLRRLPFAIHFGVHLDLEEAEKVIDAEMALSGGDSRDGALARLAIALHKSPRASAEYVEKYRPELESHLNHRFLATVEIEGLIKSGQLHRAEERIQQEVVRYPAFEERERLLLALSNARETDLTASLERQFAVSNSLADLVQLVEQLEQSKDWYQLAKYAAFLFERTRDSPSCLLQALSLFELGDFQGVVALLHSHEDLVTESEQLRSLIAWSHFNLGEMNECRAVLAQLQLIRDVPHDRELVTNLAITSGDWPSLATFVEQQWERRSSRTAEELLRAGQIAHQLASTRARAFILEAAFKADDDPHVLLGCYSAATSAGWENEGAYKWLQRAANLSDASGPVQRMSLKDLLDRSPDWHQREAQAWEHLRAGRIPMIKCARMLNRSLIDLSLLPALTNLDTIDPRRRTLVYSYSGMRGVVEEIPKSIAIDPTALLTAGMLGILKKIIDSVDRVVIPHSTLPWLFEEKQRIRFHQPSRIAEAKELKRLLDKNVLHGLDASAPINEDLEKEVGPELAALFAEAESDWGEDHRARLVVRSRPIHRAGSLMEEEAELGSHIQFVCGCLDVVEALVRQGRVTEAEEGRAKAYLKLQEKPWDEVTGLVAPRAVLYLDGLSLAHFHHLGILGKFEASGFTVMIPSSDLAESLRLIRYATLLESADVVVNGIRETLGDGIASGKVVLTPKLKANENGADAFHHPALDIVRTAGLADVAVIDDRFLNRHPVIVHEGLETPIRTTCDILAGLRLAREEHAEYMTRLRAAGHAFLPITSKELGPFLARAGSAQGRLVESAELKALRENLQLCRMSNDLRLPNDLVWFAGVVYVLMEAIRSQWRNVADLEGAKARSDWLLQLLDQRGWSHGFATEGNRSVGELRFRQELLALMVFDSDAPTASRHAYWEWLEHRLLDYVRRQQRDVYEALIGDVRKLITNGIAHHHLGDANVE